MKNIFRNIIKEEIYNEINGEQQKNVIYYDSVKNELKIGKVNYISNRIKRYFMKSVSFMPNDNIVWKSNIMKHDVDSSPMDKSEEIDVDYYTVISKNVDTMFNKALDIVNSSSDEIDINSIQNNSVFSIPSTHNGADFYLLDSEGILKEFEFVVYDEDTFHIIEYKDRDLGFFKRVRYEGGKITLIKNQRDVLKLYKMYEMLKNTLQNLYDKYKKE